MRIHLGLLFCLTQLGFAANTAKCCRILRENFPTNVFARNTSTYSFENHDYWSATEVLDPTCIFLPESTDQVSSAVKTFVSNDCQFAIKGSGHSVIPGAANIHDGVLMALTRFNTSVIDEAAGHVRVGAGLTLGEVYASLDPYNLSTIVGRYDTVGLGLAVGAGMSFFSNREGLTIDNVLNYHVVLANGTITDANATSNPSLYWALKGGNNNFGVVTHFDLRLLHTPGGVYGGIISYNESSLDQVADVIYDYHVRQAVDDVLTHTLPTYGYNGTSNETVNMTPVVYNAKVDKLPEIMKGWTDVPHTGYTLKFRGYADLARELNNGFPNGLVQEQRVISVYADAQLYKDIWAHHRQFLQQYRDIPGLYGLHCNMPITPRQVNEGVLKGGNALGLETVGNRTLGIIYFGLTFDNKEDIDRVLPAHDKFVRSMQKLAADRGLLHPYIMLTYSGWNQEAIASYGKENVARLRVVQNLYDPTKVFQRLVPGGQKLPPK